VFHKTHLFSTNHLMYGWNSTCLVLNGDSGGMRGNSDWRHCELATSNRAGVLTSSHYVI